MRSSGEYGPYVPIFPIKRFKFKQFTSNRSEKQSDFGFCLKADLKNNFHFYTHDRLFSFWNLARKCAM